MSFNSLRDLIRVVIITLGRGKFFPILHNGFSRCASLRLKFRSRFESNRRFSKNNVPKEEWPYKNSHLNHSNGTNIAKIILASLGQKGGFHAADQ
jgi:hypothetical protein